MSALHGLERSQAAADAVPAEPSPSPHVLAHLGGQGEEVVQLAAAAHELGEEGGVQVLARRKPAAMSGHMVPC